MKHSQGFEKLISSIKPNISEISIENVLGKRQNSEPFILIDVREDHEWDTSHIEGAIHIGKGIIERDIEKHFPDPSTCLILYCGGGYRSALSCESLQRMGYTNVHSLEGGFRSWCDKTLPILQK